MRRQSRQRQASGKEAAEMKEFKVPGFSFHTEPFWMWMCSVVPALVGLLIAVFVIVIRKLWL